MKLPYLFIIICVALFIIGCGDDNDDNVTGTVPLEYTFEQFVHFDTTEYRFVKRDIPKALDYIPEPLVNWEQSLGEPFIDINGNGIYDPGTDIFTVSPDPAENHDLNGNGVYDSPDDPWTEGVPFDDIDGNGIYRPDPGEHISGYVPGLPYCDYNLNYEHDADLRAAYGVAKWETGVYYIDGLEIWPARKAEAVYRFVSDSGKIYDLPLSNNPLMGSLVYTDTGLDYRVNPFTIRLLYPGTIMAEDSTRIAIPYPPDSLIYFRWVTLDQQLTVDGVTFSSLVKVRIGNEDYRYDFYFSRDLGLLAYELQQDKTAPPGEWETFLSFREYYYKRYDNSHPLIFQMTR